MAQVEVLIFNDGKLSERPLLALASEPWIATAGEEALGGDILGRIPASAVLLRAAALADVGILPVPGPVGTIKETEARTKQQKRTR